MNRRHKLAIVATHPIQYYSPWFAFLARHDGLDVRVFFLNEPRGEGLFDPGFQRQVKWDIALLDGFASEFVPNVSRDPGTHRFWGLRNPGLAKRLEAFHPDAVLLIGYNFWSLVRFVFTWRTRRAPLVFRGDSHRIVEDRGARGKVKRSLIATLFRRFSAFLYVGAANRRYFTLHGVPEGALFHAPHAVDCERFSAEPRRLRQEGLAWRASLGIPEDDAVVLFAGKLEEKKQPLALLQAFRSLGSANATLLFVGNGPLEERLRAQAGDAKVRFAPFQNQTAMPRVYAACELFVLPSYGPAETWGLAVNEAMCVGRAVLVSSHVGCAEDLVIPGKTGLVFEAGDGEALRRSLAAALEDPARLAQWGRAGREHIARYSYAEPTRGLVAALEALARRKAA